jgi:hypothetical protein
VLLWRWPGASLDCFSIIPLLFLYCFSIVSLLLAFYTASNGAGTSALPTKIPGDCRLASGDHEEVGGHALVLSGGDQLLRIEVLDRVVGQADIPTGVMNRLRPRE